MAMLNAGNRIAQAGTSPALAQVAGLTRAMKGAITNPTACWRPLTCKCRGPVNAMGGGHDLCPVSPFFHGVGGMSRVSSFHNVPLPAVC